MSWGVLVGKFRTGGSKECSSFEYFSWKWYKANGIRGTKINADCVVSCTCGITLACSYSFIISILNFGNHIYFQHFSLAVLNLR